MRRFIVVVGAVLVGLQAMVVATPSAQASGYDLVKTPYDDRVYECRPGGVDDLPFDHMHELTAWEWAQRGYPPVTTMATTYERIPWESEIVGISTLCPLLGGTYLQHLTYPQWARVGHPTPALSPVEYVRYASSPQIMATPGGALSTYPRVLSGEQWARAGHPQPQMSTEGFYRYAWSPRVFRVETTSWYGQQLGYQDWLRSGTPQPQVLGPDRGRFTATPGDPTVWFRDGQLAFPVTYDEWAAAGHPTPQP